MCCFMAPAVATAVTTVIKKKVPEKYHIEWLLSMLWGGVAMLIIEHIAHKEVVPYFPFFTAGFREMLPEILRAGIPMTLFIFVIWGSMLLGVSLAEKKKLKRLEA
jgi:hypothetical protein